MWGMSYSLTKEDIKLDDKTLPDTIQLGKKMLIRPSVFRTFANLQQRARNYLYANSFAFPLVPQAHFVPKTKFVEVFEKMREFKAEFVRLRDEFIEKYPEYKADALAYYQEHADTINVENLEELYPTADFVKAKFSFEIVSFEVKLPTEFGDVDLQTEVMREQATEEAKEAAQKAYNAEYSEQLEVHMGKINEFVGQVIDTLRQKVVEHCTLVLGKISKKEVVSDSNIKTLMKHINEFRELNFVEDRAIENHLKEVERHLTGGSDFKTDRDAVRALQNSLSSVIEEAKNVSDVANISGEYFRSLEV